MRQLIRLVQITTAYLFLFLLFAIQAASQKPIIDSSAVDNWESLSNYDPALSADGKYFAYSVQTKSILEPSLLIQNISTGVVERYKGATFCFFTADSKSAVIQIRDSLIFISLLNHNRRKCISGVVSFQTANGASGEWLVFQQGVDGEELVVINLLSGTEYKYSSVVDYSLSKSGKILGVKKKARKETAVSTRNCRSSRCRAIP